MTPITVTQDQYERMKNTTTWDMTNPLQVLRMDRDFLRNTLRKEGNNYRNATAAERAGKYYGPEEEIPLEDEISLEDGGRSP